MRGSPLTFPRWWSVITNIAVVAIWGFEKQNQLVDRPLEYRPSSYPHLNGHPPTQGTYHIRTLPPMKVIPLPTERPPLPFCCTLEENVLIHLHLLLTTSRGVASVPHETRPHDMRNQWKLQKWHFIKRLIYNQIWQFFYSIVFIMTYPCTEKITAW